MCRYMNRTGTLCGRCLPDYYPLAYSFNFSCIRCPHAHRNWLKYITAAYLPLTIFCIIILFFKINTTSSQLFAVVYYCQTISMPYVQRMVTTAYENNTSSFIIAAKSLFSIYGIWNLDFFRPFYSDLCLGIDTLPTMALDYAIAVYPLLFMIISYLLIVLYDRNYRVITVIWSPFRVLLSLFRKNWNIKTSVIDAFATFLFLSNFKFLCVSFDLLVPTPLYQLYGDHYNYTLRLYYAGHIEYFGPEHLPYAILATIVLSVFVILPIAVLALYPFKLFRRLLTLIPFRWYILHTFMDSFQGCYKNGTKPGTRDYRWFASVYFIARLCQFLLYSLAGRTVYLSFSTVILIIHITLLAVLQPFKSSNARYNMIHIIFLVFLTFLSIASNGNTSAVYVAPQLVVFFSAFGMAVAIIPFLYAVLLVLYWMYKHRNIFSNVTYRLRAWRNNYHQLPEPNDHEGQCLPDRIENSGEYPRENLANFVSQPIKPFN